VLGLPNEMVFPFNAHHRGMCRFSRKDSQNYLLLEAVIIDTAYRGLSSSLRRKKQTLSHNFSTMYGRTLLTMKSHD